MPRQKLPIEDEDKLEPRLQKKKRENLREGWKSQLLETGRKGKLKDQAHAINVGIITTGRNISPQTY